MLVDVTPAKVAEVRDRFLRTPKRTASLVHRPPRYVIYAVLSHAFTVAMKEWGWVNDNPLRRVSKPKEPRGRVRFLDDDERTPLLAACKASKSQLLYPIVVPSTIDPEPVAAAVAVADDVAALGRIVRRTVSALSDRRTPMLDRARVQG